ncbi:MAG: hypothetical protein SPJ17_00695 [Anaeroplasma sp.]|uniref:hypothetical protein n=1 Tax=Anaeroplasma sp. TaxID=1872523 RepID=UPI002A916686|nr:hypothetical protein [Anaeroplasma sp.]MDY5982207.1 hypothetical protein [Anaeroplasma sp.]
MPEWLRGLCVLGDATLIVAAITVATVAIGGAAAPVLIGTAVGAGVSGSVFAITQLAGQEHLISLGKVFADMAIGGITGAFGGTSLNAIGMEISGSATGFAGSIASDFVSGDSINWGMAIWSGILGGAIGYFGGAGAQNKKISDLTKYRNRIADCRRKGITNKYYTGAVKKMSSIIAASNQAIIRNVPYAFITALIDQYI